jgi:hypothetical protein
LDPQAVTIRREQVREAIDRYRRRRKHGLLWRPILVTKSQLDQLEQRGYLDPADAATAPTSATRSKSSLRMPCRSPDKVDHRVVSLSRRVIDRPEVRSRPRLDC